MSRWLVRTTDFEILGPYEDAALIEAIRSGRFDLHDEACCENQYWFAFHESEELKKQLGISWPDLSQRKSEEDTDEITETQSLTRTAITEKVFPKEKDPRQTASERVSLKELEGPEGDLDSSYSFFWPILALLGVVAGAFFFFPR
ncbi:MAG: hypothetical protein RJB38_1622 [Pseudomonadota bacterium]|jgi:hypothetical protein